MAEETKEIKDSEKVADAESENSEESNASQENAPKVDILEILKIISPGTEIRVSLDDILRAGTGALIVIMNDKVSKLIEGGFKVNCRFSPQRLNELSKMDGAVVLSEDLKKILFVNVLLIPDPTIPTSETGTRHKAAERTARQAGTLVIAVSERRKKITLYYGDTRYILKNAEEILGRATETLQILEKQREIYDDLLTNLNVLEVTGLVSLSDVCNILQRTEIIDRIEASIKKSIVELGKDASIVRMRLKELTRGIEKTAQLIVKDYASKPEKLRELISDISFDDLLDTEGVSKLLFNRKTEEPVHPKGCRLLSKMSISNEEMNLLLSNFTDLNSILNASQEELMSTFNSETFSNKFQKDIHNLRENILVGKKI